MSEDPFDHLNDDRDREGDPFESLDDETPTGRTDDEAWSPPDAGDGEPSVPNTGSSDRTDADTGGSDPFEYIEDRPAENGGEPGDEERPGGAGGDTVDVAGDAFGDVDVSRGDPFEETGSAFQRVDVDSVDPDAVWNRFTENTKRTDDPAETSLGGEDVPDDVSETVEVPKGRFCQTCPHFSPPPETSCRHEGTEIRRFVGTDDVRVRNCPVVAERRELGETFR